MISKFLISPLLSAAVEGYAALDRATERRRILQAAQARVVASEKTPNPRSLIIVKSPDEMRRIALQQTNSGVVVVDCALERCGTERNLIDCWQEMQRISGGGSNLFVLTIQKWSTTRLLLDPRIRWIILQTPPKGPFDYRPYGKRSTLLADTRKNTRTAHQRSRSRSAERVPS